MNRTILPALFSSIFLLLFAALATQATAQNSLPDEAYISSDGELLRGTDPVDGLYNPELIHKLEITLDDPNWFTILDGGNGPNGAEPQTLIGTLTYNDTLVLDSVVVGIKGQTSDFRNNSEKKSFNVKIDDYINQDLFGYDNLNLNGGYEDPSSMREVLYYDVSRGFTHALKGAFVDLYINGQYWGPYSNIQQIEGRYISEWFTNNNGERWRAEPVTTTGGGGGPGGGGGAFGTGTSTLNYNGPDSTDYNEDYQLKHTDSDDPWKPLIDVCDPLNNLPIEDLYEGLNDVLDIDRTLWTLAQEIVFADDDSYINKGGMDYYVYFDQATGRLMPLEVDGNSVLGDRNLTWGPFYNANDTDFPLLNRMLANDEIRQRYLAHLRTILVEHFVPAEIDARIDEFAARLSPLVNADPKALFTPNEFTSGVAQLKANIAQMHTALSSNNEVDRQGVALSALTNSIQSPAAGQGVPVTVTTQGDVSRVMLYYGEGLDGKFERIEMLDDGANGDGAAGDGIYGMMIPGMSGGSYVRYYVEAIQNDDFGTATYLPEGAEHSVYVYNVATATVTADEVVINELMADNETTQADNAGEFDDWVELHNTGSETVDVSGHFLTDDDTRPTKYEIPANATIPAGGYLVIWLDEDGSQTVGSAIHANFKLSKAGELLRFYSPSEELIDEVTFGEQLTDRSWARSPNATGPFMDANPTFAANNDDGASSTSAFAKTIGLWPNPTNGQLFIETEVEFARVEIHDALGRLHLQSTDVLGQLDVSHLQRGTFIVSAFAKTGELIGVKRLVKL